MYTFFCVIFFSELKPNKLTVSVFLILCKSPPCLAGPASHSFLLLHVVLVEQEQRVSYYSVRSDVPLSCVCVCVCVSVCVCASACVCGQWRYRLACTATAADTPCSSHKSRPSGQAERNNIVKKNKKNKGDLSVWQPQRLMGRHRCFFLTTLTVLSLSPTALRAPRIPHQAFPLRFPFYPQS